MVKKKATDAWKNLVKDFKRGPKRVKMPSKRRPSSHTPLTDLSQSKIVQLTMTKWYTSKDTVVVMYKEKFDELRLKQGKTYTTNVKKPFRAAKILKKAMDNITHNERVLQKVKIEKYAGKCAVFAGKSKNPDAIIDYIDMSYPSVDVSHYFKK